MTGLPVRVSGATAAELMVQCLPAASAKPFVLQHRLFGERTPASSRCLSLLKAVEGRILQKGLRLRTGQKLFASSSS